MTTEYMRVKGECRCQQRMEDQRDGKFFYVPLFHGYVFADSVGIPRRKDERPFVWHDCPFCGGDLRTDYPR